MDELKELKLDMKVSASGCDVDANGVWCAWGLCWTGYWKWWRWDGWGTGRLEEGGERELWSSREKTNAADADVAAAWGCWGCDRRREIRIHPDWNVRKPRWDGDLQPLSRLQCGCKWSLALCPSSLSTFIFALVVGDGRSCRCTTRRRRLRVGTDSRVEPTWARRGAFDGELFRAPM